MVPRAGRFVRQPTGYDAFEPSPLPPDPPLRIEGTLASLLSDADLALGRLDGAAGILPDAGLFLSMYVRHEAVLSSRIEGTRASLVDMLRHETGDVDDEIPKDVRDVANYVEAMKYGLARLSKLPLSIRLMREIHARLMRGAPPNVLAGELRRTQNWIGPPGSTLRDAVFVPPPPSSLLSALGDLEGFLHDRSLPALIHAGMVHAQFEAIHPFVDGNGRVGRLLVTLLLCEREVLSHPVLYLSQFIEQHRAEYYAGLQAVHQSGEWEAWLAFFLRGVAETARDANARAVAILALRERWRARLLREGKASGNLLRALDHLFIRPMVTMGSLAKALRVTTVTANKVLARLAKLGLLREITGRRRDRRWSFAQYLALFERRP